ncbi:MAG: F0F1 ATP synthase subunit delta [Betaproteobacteria bacterium]|nr:F0F1 ATP synthase subunit delta [Betaproteobacteria bacterium]
MELSTIARPYAEAAFKLADESNRLGDWSDALGALALVSQDERILATTGDPRLSVGDVANTFLRVLEGRLFPEAENFVRVMAENRRLDLLPSVREQFETLKNEREGVQEVEIVTAFPLDAAHEQDLVGRLEKQTGKKVVARISVDPELIGGARIVIGDKVIDASARAQLAALENALRA